MKYEIISAGSPTEELWQEKTVRVHSGGFSVDMTKIDAAAQAYAKKGQPFLVDFATRKATPIKSVKVTAVAGATATEYQVAKGHTFKVGDTIGKGDKSSTITAIDTTEAGYDTLTLAATITAAAVGDILSTFSGTSPVLPNVLNYADVRLEGQPSISGIYEAHEVKLSKLPHPLTAEMQTALTSRFLFIP